MVTTTRDLSTEVLQSAPILQAYLECSDELQRHAREMLAVLTDPSTDDDDRYLAASTLAEILFPDGRPAQPGVDLEETDADSEEARAAAATMDRQEAKYADRLRAAMERKGITQVELAGRIGVGQPAISNMLNRQCRPQRRTIERLAEALGVAPDDLWPAE